MSCCVVLTVRSWTNRLSIPLHGLAYPEFQYVGRREKQRKMRLGRLARQQAREFMGVRFLAADWLIDSATG